MEDGARKMGEAVTHWRTANLNPRCGKKSAMKGPFVDSWEKVTCTACLKAHNRKKKKVRRLHWMDSTGGTVCGLRFQMLDYADERRDVTCDGCRMALGMQRADMRRGFIWHLAFGPEGRRG